MPQPIVIIKKLKSRHFNHDEEYDILLARENIIPKHAFEVDKSPDKKPYYTYKEI